MTAYFTEKDVYLSHRPELGRLWQRLMGKHYPTMSMIFVSDLLDHPGKIELEVTAVVPHLFKDISPMVEYEEDEKIGKESRSTKTDNSRFMKHFLEYRNRISQNA